MAKIQSNDRFGFKSSIRSGWHLSEITEKSLQSKTYYPGYEDAPGFGVWNLHTTHSFDVVRWAFVEPSIGIDNLFDRVDTRIDSSLRKYALYTPGRMLVIGLRLRLRQ